MAIRNHLVCWEEDGTKKWNMIKEQDRNRFLLNLLLNEDVNKHTIFIIPCSGLVTGIWLWTQTHKSNRVDFWNFFQQLLTRNPPLL